MNIIDNGQEKYVGVPMDKSPDGELIEYEDGYLDTRARELFDVIYKQSPCSFYFRFLRLLRNGGEIQIEPPLPPSADFAVGSFRTIDNALYKVTKRTSKEEENPLSCLMDKEITITLTEQRYK